MKVAYLFAALFMIPAQASALKMQCNYYEALGKPSVKLEETRDEFIVSWDNFNERYRKIIVKRFGVLMDGGYLMRDDVEETHIFRHDAISGIDIIVADSIIFTPVCSGARLNAPKAEIQPEHLWFLSPKRWP